MVFTKKSPKQVIQVQLDDSAEESDVDIVGSSQTMQAASGTGSSNLYQPGQYLNTAEAVTVSEFLDPNNLALAVPVETGFIRNPESADDAIICMNYTGHDLDVVLCDPHPLSKNYPPYRENLKECNGFRLVCGTCSHFNCGTTAYTLHVYEYVISERGGKKRLTPEGIPFHTLNGLIVTVRPSSTTPGTVDITTHQGAEDGEFIVQNKTYRRIHIQITRTATAYPLSGAEIHASKLDRTIDTGGEIMEESELAPNSAAHICLPPVQWILFALQPEQDYHPFHGGGTSSSFTLIKPAGTLSPKSNYNVIGQITAQVGSVVVFFADHSRDGAIVVKSYPQKRIKFVNPDITITKRNVR